MCVMKQNGNFRSSALFYNCYNIYNIVSDHISTIYNSEYQVVCRSTLLLRRELRSSELSHEY